MSLTDLSRRAFLQGLSAAVGLRFTASITSAAQILSSIPTEKIAAATTFTLETYLKYIARLNALTSSLDQYPASMFTPGVGEEIHEHLIAERNGSLSLDLYESIKFLGISQEKIKQTTIELMESDPLFLKNLTQGGLLNENTGVDFFAKKLHTRAYMNAEEIARRVETGRQMINDYNSPGAPSLYELTGGRYDEFGVNSKAWQDQLRESAEEYSGWRR